MREWFQGESKEDIDLGESKTIGDSDLVDQEVDPKDGSADDFLTPGEAVYTPALSVTMSNFFAKDYSDIELGDYRLTWWEDDSILPKHPFMLINPVAWAMGSVGVVDDVTEKLGVDPAEDQYVFVDSGGFQIKSFDEAMMTSSRDLHDFSELKIHPEKLLEWQVTNGTAGAVLDIPPFTADKGETTIEGVSQDSYSEWYEEAFVPSKEESFSIARQMSEHKKDIGADDFSLFGVVHGVPKRDPEEPHESWLQWYEMLQEAGDFDGMAFGITNMQVGKTALLLSFAANYVEEDHLHLLGTSSLLDRVLADFFLVCNPEFSVTMDSTGFTVGGKYRQMLNPVMPGREFIVSQRETELEPIQTDFYPCRCVVCSRVAESQGKPNWYLSGEETEISTAMNMHNLNMLLQYHQTMAAFVQSHGKKLVDEYDPQDGVKNGNQFWKMFGQVFAKENVDQIYEAFRFIKLASEHDLTRATDEFDVYNRFESGPNGRMIAERKEKSFMNW